MSAYPSIVAMPMAVEPTKALKSAAAQLEMDQQVLVSGAEVEQSPLQQRSVHKHVCTLMSMLCLVPNICRVSHSLYVPERVFPLYNKTGIAHFCKNMESPPVAPVPPKCIPRHSRGTPEALPRHCRSSLRWSEVRVDHKFHRERKRRSDHFALRAECSWCDSEKVKREPRIKPEVMKKPEVRERVQRLIRSRPA